MAFRVWLAVSAEYLPSVSSSEREAQRHFRGAAFGRFWGGTSEKYHGG